MVCCIDKQTKEIFRPITIQELSYFYSLNISSVSQYKDVIGTSYVRHIMEEMNWKGSTQALLERVILMFKNPFKLSVREFKMLRKTYYQKVSSGMIDWNEIVNIFPEKDPGFIIQTCKSLPGKGVNPKANSISIENNGVQSTNTSEGKYHTKQETHDSKSQNVPSEETFHF